MRITILFLLQSDDDFIVVNFVFKVYYPIHAICTV